MNIPNKWKVIQIIFVFVWLSLLINTDSYFIIYVLVGLLSILGISNKKQKYKLAPTIFSSLFSLAVCLANYNIFTEYFSLGYLWQPLSILLFFLTFANGFFTFYNLLNLAEKTITAKKLFKKTKPELTPFKILFICFGIISIINLLVFFTAYYPGNLTPDSIYQIQQIMTDTYTNHHPFYFTLIIKLFISLGLKINGDINFGVALYNIFQILVLSASFSYSMLTLYQKGISHKTIIILTILIAIMPYNIMYSFTVWKDVLFGASVLVLITSFYRYFTFKKQRQILTLILIALSGIAVCLFRSNGFLAFFITTLFFFFIFRKQYLKLGGILIGVIILSFILKKPVLKLLNVPQPDTVESLSIPMQQISRTIIEKKDYISQDDLELLDNVIDTNLIPQAYNPTLHDPIKELARAKDNQAFIQDNKLSLLLLYFKLGVKYPSSYLKAFIDQTKGYYNSGYDYWIWQDRIVENEYGIEKTVASPTLHDFFTFYMESYSKIPFLNPFISIGLAVWILLIILYLAIIRKTQILIFLSLPLVAIIFTLLIATPVFSEFRYAYSLFTCLPFLIPLAFIETRKGAIKS